MAKTKGPHLTRTEIEEYLDLERARLAKQREAADLEKLAKVLKAKILDYIEAEGGKARSCERSGFVLAVHQKAGSVSWKEEFLIVAGQVKAAELVAACPKRDYLVVEPKA